MLCWCSTLVVCRGVEFLWKSGGKLGWCEKMRVKVGCKMLNKYKIAIFDHCKRCREGVILCEKR